MTDTPESEPRPRGPAFLAALANRSYRHLWTGAFLSSMGTWTQDVALAWLIHTRFANPLYLGLRSFAAEAPIIAFSLVGGAAADRFDRRRILLTSQFVQMGCAAALVVLYFTDHLGLPLILLVAFGTGLAQSQSAPTYQAVLTTLVPPHQISNAVALNSLQFNLSRTIGPVIAGLLLVHSGPGTCFAVNVVSFLAVIIALLGIAIPSPRVTNEGLRQSLAEGFRHVLDTPLLRLLTVMGASATFLTYPMLTYLPVFADEVLGTGASGYSLLLSSFGVGAIGGAVATAHRGRIQGRGKLVLQTWIVYSLTTLAALLCRNQWLAMAFIAASGTSLVMGSSTMISLVQENVPDRLRGRMMSIWGVAFRGGMPLGSLAAGVLVKAFGVVPALSALTVVLLLLGLVLYWRAEPLRQL